MTDEKQELSQPSETTDALLYSQLLDLHIAEYNAMRAEQRTRLDSATKFIQYYSAIAAASAAALVAASKDHSEAIQRSSGLICLLFCGVTVLVALAQYYEELFVLKIGDYFDQILKRNISKPNDEKYWNWEKFHYDHENERKYPFFRAAGFFRFGFLPLLAALSLGYAIYDFWMGPTISLLRLYPCRSLLLVLLDIFLLLLAGLTGKSLSVNRSSGQQNK